jgi:hypothetical protein
MALELTEAVGVLNGTLSALLPGVADPALASELFVHPLRSQLSGVGGVVGSRTRAPLGDVMALRVTAEVVVRVKAANVAQLAQAESDVSVALLGADPVSLRQNGVFRIRRSPSFAAGVTAEAAAAEGAPDALGRDVRFEVLYEFSKLPDVGAGIIASVPVDLIPRSSVGPLKAPAQLLRLDFEQDPLANFEILDDTGLNEAGRWEFSAAEGEVRQTSTASGGSDAFDPEKRGTYLLVRSAATGPAPRNFVLYASVRSDSSGGLGFVFRFLDLDNFYYVLLQSAPLGYRIMGRKQNGSFALLEFGGAEAAAGYAPNQWFSLRLAVQDEQFDLAIDGVVVLSGRDAGISAPGRVGFVCRGDAGARFRFLHWAAL